MNPDTGTGKVKRRKTRLWLWIFLAFILAGVAGFVYLTRNYNRLLSEALLASFNDNLVSDVYELKFKGLDVNLVTGNIEVFDVELKPREKPLNSYPYINSHFSLKTGKLLLLDVKIMKLLREKRLDLDKIEILEPEIKAELNGEKYVFVPFRDSSAQPLAKDKNKKRPIESYHLAEFSLKKASLHVVNHSRHREFRVKNLNISLDDLLLDQQTGVDLISNKKVLLTIDEMSWRLHKEAIKYISVKDYKLQLDSVNISNSKDTSILLFKNFSTGLKELDLQTGDSIFHLTMQSFNLSYRDKAITLKNISFKPNLTDAAMQRRFTYRTPVFSGTVGSISLVGLNFDSLIYRNKVLIDELGIEKATLNIFTDQSKPVNMNKFPGYPGQQIAGIPLPLKINKIKAHGLNLVNREKTPNGGMGKVNISKVNLQVNNFTNQPTRDPLSVSVDANIEAKAHVKARMWFSYHQPLFTVQAKTGSFNLPDMNALLSSYTPATVNKGIVDELDFTTHATRDGATGEMKFLYHDLNIDLELAKKAKWKSDLLSWASNTVLSSSNPTSAKNPPKHVKFEVKRDMNKGFVNIIIKSMLAGFKETMIMSKENRQAYKAEKKAFRKNRKNQKAKE